MLAMVPRGPVRLGPRELARPADGSSALLLGIQPSKLTAATLFAASADSPGYQSGAVIC